MVGVNKHDGNLRAQGCAFKSVFNYILLMILFFLGFIENINETIGLNDAEFNKYRLLDIYLQNVGKFKRKYNKHAFSRSDSLERKAFQSG